MGKRPPIDPTAEADADLYARRRRSLARKIKLMSAEMVRNSISEAHAEGLGLGREWRQKAEVEAQRGRQGPE